MENVYVKRVNAAMTDISIPAQFKTLRERSGLSIDALAKKMGFKGGSSIQRYEDADAYRRDYLSPDIAGKLAKAIVGLGDPPIKAPEVMRLTTTASQSFHDVGKAKDTVRELDAKAGAGGGGIFDLINVTDSQGNQVSGEIVKDYWRIPESYLRGELRLEAGKALIIEVTGDSGYDPSNPHAPGSIFPGDRVIVDARDTRPSPPGPFLVYDGTGLVVKLCEPVFGVEPAQVRLLSRNPTYSPYTITTDDGHLIVGRVKGRISAM